MNRADAVVTRGVGKVVRGCYVARDDVTSLRKRLLERIRSVVTIEAAFFAAADPETLLFTSLWAEAPLAAAGPLFLDNEFGATVDVNRFGLLARARRPVGTLDGATAGNRAASPRFREIMAPLRLGDELRIALRTGGATWGFLCLHREGKSGFSERDIAILMGIGPHAGEALRRIVAGSFAVAAGSRQPPAVLLTEGGVVTAMTGNASSWLDELHESRVEVGDRLPLAVLAVLRRLEALEALQGLESLDGPGGLEGGLGLAPPRLTVATRAGSLLEVHAARMSVGPARMSVGPAGDAPRTGRGTVAITLAPAGAAARSGLMLAARGLTPAQRRVAARVLEGLSTREIVGDLRISEHTVQDHLKAVFDKMGVGSRRELVAALRR